MLAVAGLTGFALWAGGKSYRCDADTQTCLNAMVGELSNRGWVGIEMEEDEETGARTIRRVVSGSPAEKGGFLPGDILRGVNGITFTEENQDKLKANSKRMVPGEKFVYTVERDGRAST